MKSFLGFQWVLRDPDLTSHIHRTTSQKAWAVLEPGSYKQALLNFREAILLNLPKDKLSLAILYTFLTMVFMRNITNVH